MNTPARPLVISCAFALAEVFFGTADTGHAQFLLTGRVDVWPGYWELSEEDRQRAGDLLRHRSEDLANTEVFLKAVRELAPAGRLDGYRQDAETIRPIHGVPPRQHADRLLSDLARLRQSRVLKVARPGRYVAMLHGMRVNDATVSAEAAYNLTDLGDLAQMAPAVTDAPRLDAVEISLDELKKTAERIDDARGESHRLERLEAIFARLPERALLVRSGGIIQPLQAPTGFGKSVLLEVLGTMAPERGVRMALVVPSRAAALALTYQIETNLSLLEISGSCAPLVSPAKVMEDAERIARDDPGGFGTWAYDRLSYGCALSASAETEETVDGWKPGDEPCRDLHLNRLDGRRHACPWRSSCGKFRLMRDAVEADVIVTVHQTFTSGRMHIPLTTARGVSDQVPVEEFLLRHCQLIVIDELDQFQNSVIGKSARHLELAHGRRTTPIHRLDNEFRDVFGLVPPKVDGEIRAILSDLRLLSEQYIANLVKEWSPPVRVTRNHRRVDHWIVPRGHDAWITARLLGLDTEDRKVTPDEVEALQQLYAAPGTRPVPPLKPTGLDEGTAAEIWARITAALTAISDGCRTDTLMTHKVALSESLQSVLPGDRLRGDVVDRMIRRAHLEPLRRKLSELFYRTAHLRALGVESAETIADALGGFTAWEAMPASPLGRLFFAFKERYDKEQPRQTKLSVAAFGGDPHGYVRYLGEITARGHARVPRGVLGLSATSFLPGAPHHHVLADPAWVIPDTDPTGVTIHAARVFGSDQRAIRVSGVQGRQREINLGDVAEGLYRLKLSSHLRELARQRDERGEPGRDRVLVATTSYDSVLTIAEGMVRAGAPHGSLCLLARPKGEILIKDPRWHVLPSDRVERFPSTGADILIAPLAVVERGVNILDGRVSALGAIYMVVRPVPVLDEPEELLAHISHRLWADTRDEDRAFLDLLDPLDRMEERMRQAGRHFEEIVRSAQYFGSLPEWVQLGIVAEIIVGLVQLVGRARRGGTPGEVHLVDDAFFDSRSRSDLPTLIGRLRERWTEDRQLDRLLALYGPTLQAFFDFADRMNRMTSPGEPS
ncbi:hypothetical protein [Streptosporangium carneum]|uniref:Uncharacterized protein n=1 Tax=Streptosporangium carneum TaxID=47481 RepID=A0A9W6HZ40_9ACTN|nr:hypothetical protein [Streptosporangium carneum]GLK08228.1 hypothetical protein GCM10017600_16330 [Streptosporangium carneum]